MFFSLGYRSRNWNSEKIPVQAHTAWKGGRDRCKQICSSDHGSDAFLPVRAASVQGSDIPVVSAACSLSLCHPLALQWGLHDIGGKRGTVLSHTEPGMSRSSPGAMTKENLWHHRRQRRGKGCVNGGAIKAEKLGTILRSGCWKLLVFNLFSWSKMHPQRPKATAVTACATGSESPRG